MMRRFAKILSIFFFLAGFLGGAFSSARAQTNSDTEIFHGKRGSRNFQAEIIKEAPDPDTGRPARAGSLLVRFKDTATLDDQDQLNRQVPATKIERLILKNTQRVRVPESLVAKVLEEYRANPAVEYAVADRMVYALATPNDPRFSEQWGMAKINVAAAWDTSPSQASTRIAILDCGVYDSASTFVSPDGNTGHPDVRDKVIARVNFTSAANADDFCNHGTHVAGIAAASTNNGIGVTGVGNTASIVNVKVLGDNGSGSFSGIINGILWAAGCDTNPCGARRAEVINMSLGATGSCDVLVQSAIDKAWSQGLVIVAAAGNNGTSGAITPANCNNVIGVAASDQNDAKASFSNFGSGVDVAAPGVNILSTDYIGNYALFSGTSMASPHVAGLAALIWNTSYNTSNSGVVNRIFQTANTSFLAGSTFGRIDALQSVTSGTITPTPAPPTPTPTPTPALTGCLAPVITSHIDTSPTRGGTVTFSWAAQARATTYRIQRQNSGGSWSTRATVSTTSYTGSDGLNDPNWRISVQSGSCTPLPGPATTFDP
jgi:thermitase